MVRVQTRTQHVCGHPLRRGYAAFGQPKGSDRACESAAAEHVAGGAQPQAQQQQSGAVQAVTEPSAESGLAKVRQRRVAAAAAAEIADARGGGISYDGTSDSGCVHDIACDSHGSSDCGRGSGGDGADCSSGGRRVATSAVAEYTPVANAAAATTATTTPTVVAAGTAPSTSMAARAAVLVAVAGGRRHGARHCDGRRDVARGGNIAAGTCGREHSSGSAARQLRRPRRQLHNGERCSGEQ